MANIVIVVSPIALNRWVVISSVNVLTILIHMCIFLLFSVIKSISFAWRDGYAVTSVDCSFKEYSLVFSTHGGQLIVAFTFLL